MCRPSRLSGALLGMLVLFGSLSAAAETPLNHLSRVEVRETDRSTEIVVTGTAAPTFTVFKLSDPTRLFVDISNADITDLAEPLEVGNGVINQINALYFRDDLVQVGRIVVGLETEALYKVRADGNALRITIDASSRTVRRPMASNAAGSGEARVLVEAAEARARTAEARAQAAKTAAQRAQTQLNETAKQHAQVAEAATARAELAESDRNRLSDALKDITKQQQASHQQVQSLESGKATLAAELEAARRDKDRALTRKLEAEEVARTHALTAEHAQIELLEAAKANENLQVQISQLEALVGARPAGGDKETQGRLTVARAELKALQQKLAQNSKALKKARTAARKSERVAKRLRKKLARAQKRPRRGQPTRIANVKFEDDADRSRLVVVFEGTPDYVVRRDGQMSRILEIRNARIDRAIEQRLDTSAFPSPVQLVSSFQVAGEHDTVHVAVTLAKTVRDAVVVRGRTLIWTFEKSADAQRYVHQIAPHEVHYDDTQAAVYTGMGQIRTRGGRRSQRKVKRYKGRKINIDIKDGDIHNVLRLLAKEGNVNIVVSDDIKGSVSMHLKLVPWDEALDIIVRSKGLETVQEGSIIRIAKMEQVEKERAAALKRIEADKKLEPLEVRLLTVNHATAQSLLPRILSVLSNRGKTEFDARTNTVIIKDTVAYLDAAEDMVRRLDTQTPQVLIEARIVEVNTVNELELGIQWGGDARFSAATGNPTGLRFPSTIGIAGGADDPQVPTAGTVSTPNFAVNLPAATGGGSGGALGFTFGSIDSTFNLNVRLSALENRGTVKIVSSPRITTLDNQRASISQGVSIPISQVSAAGVQTVFFDATLKLQVKPHVTQDGSIYLDIQATNNTPDFQNVGARGDPTILKKEAKTALILKDGDTTVIGGIYTSNSGLSSSSVPYLSKIPILGALFRKHQESERRTELLIFVTPRIVNRAAATVRTNR